VGTGFEVPACTLTVSMPEVVKPLADASMQALSKLVEGVAGAVAGQLVATALQNTAGLLHAGMGAEVTAARTAATAAASAAACAACCR
jgi:hypothetical protein